MDDPVKKQRVVAGFAVGTPAREEAERTFPAAMKELASAKEVKSHGHNWVVSLKQTYLLGRQSLGQYIYVPGQSHLLHYYPGIGTSFRVIGVRRVVRWAPQAQAGAFMLLYLLFWAVSSGATPAVVFQQTDGPRILFHHHGNLFQRVYWQ